MKSSVFSAVLAAFAGLASAFTTPTDGPIGNPIAKPGLHEKVPVGKPYTITWEPTLDKAGTVTLVLMKGPATNIIPMYPIVEKTPNTGSYVWTPDTSFPDTEEGYGIQLIVDSTGQYQWSTQFGFANEGVVDQPSSSSSVTDYPTSSTTATGEATTTSADVETTTTVDYEPDTTTTTTTSEDVKTSSAVVYPNITITSVEVTSTTEKPIVTPTEAPTTLATVTLTTIGTNGTSTTSRPAPIQSNAGVQTVAISYGMALVAVAVAGFSMV